MKPILAPAQVDRWVARHRQAGRSIGYACGAFDLLHAGHVDYLGHAKRLCDRLLVAVNSDRSVASYKSPLRPINPEGERQLIIAALGCVDAVTLLDEPRPLAQLQRWRPDFYFKGGDYHPSALRSAGAVETYGGKSVVIPVKCSTSTSAILERAALLGRHADPEKLPASGPARLVFADRDGTILREVPFLHEPERVELLPGSGEGLAALQALGFRLVVVSNQQGIGLGYYTTQEFIAVNRAMFRLLAPLGVKISRIYHCPHSLADACHCRKPATLLLERALQDYGARAETCYLIGDEDTDAEAAARLGCPSVVVGPGASARATYRAASFSDAVNWICGRELRAPAKAAVC